MIKVRFRERTNAWPGFVDLFSNLVIILIFLLIVFVFLWTTTSVFNKRTGAKTVAELKQVNAEQAQTIQQMTADEQEAKRLLILARSHIESVESSNAQLADENNALANELQEIDLSIEDLIAAYEGQVSQLEFRGSEMEKMIAELNTRLAQAQVDSAEIQKLEQARDAMQAQLAQVTDQVKILQEVLDMTMEQHNAQAAQYVEMSNRLNKALADKVAELNQVSQYQSEFYKAVKQAIGDRTTIRDDGDRFIVSSDILFPSGSYKLSAAGRDQLRLVAGVIKDLEEKIPSNIDWIIRVDGHTDRTGVRPGTRGYKNNTELSFLRATAVVDALTAAGVSKRRLVPSGFGEMHPVALGRDRDSLQKNRRIELQLTNR